MQQGCCPEQEEIFIAHFLAPAQQFNLGINMAGMLYIMEYEIFREFLLQPFQDKFFPVLLGYIIFLIGQPFQFLLILHRRGHQEISRCRSEVDA